MKSLWWKYGGRMGAIALVGLTTAVSRADDETKEQSQPADPVDIVIDLDKDAAEAPLARERFFRARAVKLSDYWLGLECSPLSAAMRSQLKLDEDRGLMIENVVPDSPAAKAGFQKHDIVLSAGDKPLKDLEPLVQLLDENKDQEIKFDVLRGGEKLTVAATPEKRPQPDGPPRDRLKWLAGDGQKAFEILREQLEKSGMPMRMQFFHPGMVMPRGASVAEFPENLHLHFDKQGGKPAKIIVERGEEKWEVNEDELDNLPEDVRTHVESLLGRMPMPKFNVEIEGAPAAGLEKFNIPLPPPSEISDRLEERLEDLGRRMEKMREQLNEIREQRKQNRDERRDSREERRDDRESDHEDHDHEEKADKA